jgi:hypothetical protein
MSLGGGQTQSPVAGSNKYDEIMELMRRRNATTPQSYTGGYGSLAAAPASSGSSSAYDEILRLQALNNPNRFLADGRGSGDRQDQTRVDAFMDAEDAKDIAEGNPVGTTRGARLQQDLPFLFVNPITMLSSLFSPQDSGYNSDALGTGISTQSQDAATNAQVEAAAQANAANTVNVNDAASIAAADSARAYAAAVAEGLKGENQGASYGESFGNDAGGNYGGDGTSAGPDGGGFGGVYSRGGYVNKKHLKGPNPMGPDDGYGALRDGEFVMNPKSVGKYGIELMNAINAGKISKGKLRGLLEA